MIFDKLFGKKEEVRKKEEHASLDFAKLPEWVKGEIEDLDEEADEISKLGMERINDSFRRLEEIVNELDEKEMDQEVLRKLENITITSKKKFCENMKIVLSKKKWSNTRGYAELDEYIRETEETVRSINKTHTTHGRYLGIVFQSYLKDMGKELKNIVTTTGLMKQKMGLLTSRWKELENISGLLDEYQMIHHGGTDIKIEGLETEKAALADELHSLEQRRKELVSSDQYKEHTKATARIDEIEDEEERLNHDIYGHLGQLKRILKKMHKAIENGRFSTNYDNFKFLDSFIEHPAVTLIGDGKDMKETKRLMRTMLEALDKGIIDEKRSKVEKIRSIGESTISGEIVELRRQYDLLEEEKGILCLKRDEYDVGELLRIEKDMEHHAHRIAMLGEEQERTMSLSNELSEKKRNVKMKIKRIVEDFHPEITINL
ncbi:MAG: hypothetical protein JW825_03165 [Candidatus Methanofastidiosa archaeon]|nr:hypothetical protein [Candidatus Methanofastidiosa archaeon]